MVRSLLPRTSNFLRTNFFYNSSTTRINYSLSRRFSTAEDQSKMAPFCCGQFDFLKKNGNWGWYVPKGFECVDEAQHVNSYVGLKIKNSLTEENEPFIPHEGRRVKWYVCGPTVYDHAHLGHARAYLTFDIMRRIVEDYFGYEVFYQMNVTDIDDKIIMRARQNALLSEYREKNKSDFGKVKKDLDALVGDMKPSLEGKLEESKRELEKGKKAAEADPSNKSNATVISGLEDEKMKCELMMKNLNTSSEALNAAAAKNDVSAMIDCFADDLKKKLDKETEFVVKDNQIFEDLARVYEKSFWEDLDSLQIRQPDAVTRVTEYVPEIVDFINTIIKKGGAYESNGSVYFDINHFIKEDKHDYPKLRKGIDSISAADMVEGEGQLGVALTAEKRNPNDFALWKKSKAGEPFWDSPWGLGRPGWHIECSVMASDLIGERLDIHGGGGDLKFPHHSNEMAQSECFHSTKQWCNYWTHAGQLKIDGLKMSKSLKNFTKIKEAMEFTTARQLRITFLTQRWDRELNYSDEQVENGRKYERSVKQFCNEVKRRIQLASPLTETVQKWDQREKDLNDAVADDHEAMHLALLDNFDTATVMLKITEVMTKCNKYMTEIGENRANGILILRKAASLITRYLRCFGVIQGNDDIGFSDSAGSGESKLQTVTPYMNGFSSFRDEIRNKAMALVANKSATDDGKQFAKELLALCDNLRDESLPQLGIRLADGGKNEAAKWQLENPEELLLEMKRKNEEKFASELRTVDRQLTTKKNDMDKLRTAFAGPASLEDVLKSKKQENSENQLYTDDRDADGMPTKLLADNSDVPKAQLKKLQKESTKLLAGRKNVVEKTLPDYLVKNKIVESADAAAKLSDAEKLKLWAEKETLLVKDLETRKAELETKISSAGGA